MSYFRMETAEGPRVVQSFIAPVLDVDPHAGGVDKPKISERPPEQWYTRAIVPIEGACLGTWVIGGRYVLSQLDSASLHDAHVGVAVYPPGPDPKEYRLLDDCITRDEQLILDAEDRSKRNGRFRRDVQEGK